MRNLFLTFILVLFSLGVMSQTIVFQENFENLPLSMTSSTTGTSQAGIWVQNSRLATQGLKSDSARVTLGDTTYLTSNTFSTLGKYSVFLYFDQICKTQYFDGGVIEVSANNGATWTPLNGSQYMGAGQFGTIGNKFSGGSYIDWLLTNVNAIPTSTWWKSETFDLSLLIPNTATAKIRFKLFDGGMVLDGSGGAAGWFLDSIRVSASFSEMINPTISIISPYPHDTVYGVGPFNLKAKITDASGIDTAIVHYLIQPGNITGTIGMNMTTTDTFAAVLPFPGFGRSVFYYINAIDGSFAANSDSTNNYWYYCKYSTGSSGTVGTGTSTVSYLYNTFWHDSRAQMLYTAAELSAAGLSGGSISKVGFNIGTVGGQAMENFNIKMKSTSATSLTAFDNTNLSTVYSATYTVPGTGWQNINLTTPFVWDGVSNLIVEVCFDNTSYTSATTVYATPITGMAWSQNADGAAGCQFSGGYAQSSRVNIKLEAVGVSSISNDIGVYTITSPTGGVIANQAFDVKVQMKNFGVDTIHTATINWIFDGVAQTPYSFSGILLPGALSSEILLGSKTVSIGSHSFTAWTDNPDGNFDNNIANDTSSFDFYGCASTLSGAYTIGGTSPDYATFTAAALALNQCGISGPVTFNVAAGTYNEQILLNAISGCTSTNTITFKAANNDSTSVVLQKDATGNVDNYVVTLNGAQNIFFKNMTVKALDSTYSKVFVLKGNVANLGINNSIIEASIRSNANNDKSILVSSSNALGNTIVLTNNIFNKGSQAINLLGDSSTTGWNISNNKLINHYSAGINLANVTSPTINGNTIEASHSNSASYNGIRLTNTYGSPSVQRNKIQTDSTQMAYGISFIDAVHDSLNPALIANNMIRLNTNSTTTTLSAGILGYQSVAFNVYHNTVLIVGNQTNSTAITLYDLPAMAGTSQKIKIVNNIFVNNAKGYIYYVTNVDTALWYDAHNILYNFNQSTVFSYLGAAINNYTSWITNSGTLNSDTIDPYFYSWTNLHIANNKVNGKGVALASVTTDIDGEARNATIPDPGADEFTPSPYDITTLNVVTPNSACGLSTTETVSIQIKNIGSAVINGGLTASYKVNGNTSVTEIVTNVMSPGDTVIFTFATKANFDVTSNGQDSTFNLKVWANLTGDNVYQNDSSFAEIVSGYIPALVTVQNHTISYGQNTVFTALGNNIYWWADDTTSVYLANSGSFTTPFLYDTTTYWVSDRAGTPNVQLTIGNGTSYNGGTGYPCAYSNWYWGNKEQYLILASELNALGMSAGSINSLALNVVALNLVPALNNYSIAIGQTNLTSLTSTFIATNLTTVFSPSSSYMPVAGWNTHSFSSPFIWDGISNIVVQTCSNNSSYVSNGNASVEYTVTTFPSVTHYYQDASGTCALTTGSVSSKRPNIKLVGTASGCFGDRSSVTAVVIGFPTLDAGLNTFVSPSPEIDETQLTSVKVILKNHGQNPLTSVKIPVIVDGVAIDTLFYTGSITYNNVDTVTLLANYNFTAGNHTLKAYTYYPNSMNDTIHSNDTISLSFVARMNGTYTISNTNASADFATFTDAVSTLNGVGIIGPVVFLVDSGSYTQQISISSIDGVSATNTITFKSASGVRTDVVLQFASFGSSTNYVLKINGGDFITFQDMTLKALGAYYGGVIEMAANSLNITFDNLIIESISSTSSYARGMYASAGPSHNLVIKNSLFSNCYYTIYVNGSSSNYNTGMVINNNIIENAGYYGGLYLTYAAGALITGNTITSMANFSGGYGLYLANCNAGTKVLGNKVHMNLSSTAYSGYGIYLYGLTGTNTVKNLLANNFVASNSGSTTNAYGIYSLSNTNTDIFYNSVNIKGLSVTSHALDVNSSAAPASVRLINNVLYDSTGYAFYGSGVSGISTMNYNSYATDGSKFTYWNGNNADLEALKTASGKNANSVQFKPVFTSNTDLHLLSTQYTGYGTPLSSVTTDIDGTLRGINATTIGAHEVPQPVVDLGLVKILDLTSNEVEFDSIHMRLVIRNFGSDSIPSFSINYTLNGGAPVTDNFNYIFHSAEVDTLTLTAFVVPGGQNNICINSVTPSDANIYNNQLCKNFYGQPIKDAYVISMKSIEEYCGMTTDTVTITIVNNGLDTINGVGDPITTVSYQSNNFAVVTENLTAQILPNSTLVYNFVQQVYVGTNNLIDSTYNIKAWINLVNDNVAVNDSASTEVTSFHIPLVPVVVSPFNVVYGSPATLIATSVDTVLWYTGATAINYFHYGSSYTTGYNYNNDTLWLAALNGKADLKITEIVQYKTGTGYTNPYPAYMSTGDFDGFEISNLGSDVQMLGGWTVHVRGAQIIDYTFPSGTVLNAGEVLTCLYVSGATVGAAGNNLYYLATNSSISSSSLVGYILKDNIGNVIDAVATNNYTFASADGVTSADWSGTVSGLSGLAGVVRIISDNNTSSDWSATNVSSSSFGASNSQLGSSMNGCVSAKVPLIINVTGQLASDVGTVALLEPISMLNLSNSETVKIRVRNFGTAACDTIPVGYKINNGNVIWDTIYNAISAGDSIEFTFSQHANLGIQGNTYNFKAFTSLSSDLNQLNDTIIKSVVNMIPNYCPSYATSTVDDDIVNVTFAGMNNTSPTPYTAVYTDYSTSVAPVFVNPGMAFPISIEIGFSSSNTYSGYCEVYIDYNRDGTFTEPNEVAFGDAYSGAQTISGIVTIPFNAITGLTKMRIVARESANAGSVMPCGTYTWGETEDYNVIIAPSIPMDAGVERIVSPGALSSATAASFKVQVRNYGTDTINSVDVKYSVNNGSVNSYTYNITPIYPLDSAIVDLGNLSMQMGANVIKVYTQLLGDTNNLNDTLVKSLYREAVMMLPYTDNFEGANYWIPDTITNIWELGTPSTTYINGAYSPVNAWVTNLDGNYSDGLNDNLYSPVFNIPTYADSAYLKFWHKYQTQSAQDGGTIQVKIDNGAWINLGLQSDPDAINWYTDNVGGTHMWTGSHAWHKSTYRFDLTTPTSQFYNASTIQFRFIFKSNSSSSAFEGWAIDNVEMVVPVLPDDVGVTAITVPGTDAQMGSAATVTIDVSNFGLNTQYAIPVRYSVNGAAPIQATFNIAGGLAGNATASYTFTPTFTVPTSGFNLCAYTTLISDVATQNDTTCKAISVTPGAIDAGVVKLWVTPSWHDTTKISKDDTVHIQIVNFGLNTLTSIPVNYRINGNVISNETWTGSLAKDDTATYNFVLTHHCPIGSYLIDASTLIVDDVNSANNLKYRTYIGIFDEGGIGNGDGLVFAVDQNEPNPANDFINIRYFLPSNGELKVEVRNTIGQIVFSETKDDRQGTNALRINATHFTNGVYYYTFEFDGQRITRKLVVNK